ncbi:hypothetical protein NPIL_266101 [Nephila pilipes]|uniref:Uncharacterized protein n=1 Tax=Nephila pilipes TaxID=299642 RepID=A0A8X6TNS6_NEPPI|nr:hypothetical protein NPIL_266101 [Nephila pilipes]
MGNLMNKDCLFYSRSALLISSEREYIKSPHPALYYKLFLVTRFSFIPSDFFRRFNHETRVSVPSHPDFHDGGAPGKTLPQ